MMQAAKLRGLSALREFTDAELAVLVAAAHERAVGAGSLVCKQGAAGASCFLLVEGELEVVRESGGAERVLATMKPGAFVGQIALVDRGPRSATVRARVESVLLELARDVFEQLLKARSPLALRFQDLIAVAGIRQLRAAVERLGALVQKRGEARTSAAPAKTDEALAYIQTATSEWGLSMEELDAVKHGGVARASDRPRTPRR